MQLHFMSCQYISKKKLISELFMNQISAVMCIEKCIVKVKVSFYLNTDIFHVLIKPILAVSGCWNYLLIKCLGLLNFTIPKHLNTKIWSVVLLITLFMLICCSYNLYILRASMIIIISNSYVACWTGSYLYFNSWWIQDNL